MVPIRAMLTQMVLCVENIRTGVWKGFRGRPIKDIVVIGHGAFYRVSKTSVYITQCI